MTLYATDGVTDETINTSGPYLAADSGTLSGTFTPSQNFTSLNFSIVSAVV
jgi:hypothetical protein